MEDVVSRLRRTRANMLGTDDGEHFYDCHDAADEIERLREWIRNTGTATDICTFVVLGEICENCRCGKDKMPNAEVSGAARRPLQCGASPLEES